MSRIDRERLINGAFPFQCEVQTRFSDVDVQGHLNNVAVALIIQEGRSRFSAMNNITAFVKDRSVMVASLTIEFAGEMRHPDPIDLRVGILEIGRTSYRIGEIARQSGKPAAFAEIVMVAGKDGAPFQMDDPWRAKLESLRIK